MFSPLCPTARKVPRTQELQGSKCAEEFPIREAKREAIASEHETAAKPSMLISEATPLIIRPEACYVLLTKGCGPQGKGEKVKSMETMNTELVVGRHCHLNRPVRDRQGMTRFNEQPVVLREVNNLDRRMYLVQFDDGSTTFLFPDEITLE
jgi:hypothetical protein